MSLPVFLRLFAIIRIAIKHRLDTFFTARPLPWALRMLFLPARLLPEPRRPRGQRLREACEDLGPIFIKFGQLLSTRPDLVPADIAGELDRLQDNVPPFPSEQFQGIVEEALGGPVETLFAHFERDPLASASVAQVHAAVLPDGQQVVVKAIRPGIEKVISKDVALMLILARWLQRVLPDGRRLRPVEVVEEYRYTINNELDLQREAANASQLRRNFSHSPLLYVPDVYWPLVRSKVMVMERINGIPVTDVEALRARGTDMKLLAERGVEIFFSQVFEHNFFHADMHPGNIFVDASAPERPSYIAVDMAIVGSLTREDQYYLARNLLAMFRRDYRMVAELHVMSGWVREDTNVNEFEAAVRTVCEPIFERPLKDISFGRVVFSLFQTAREFDMEVQPQLVLLQKTLLNIEGLGRQLYPDLDLWRTAHPYLERWLHERFHPRALAAQLRRYGPEWLEKFPQVPNLLFQSLEQLSDLDQRTRELNRQAILRQQREERSRRRGRLGMLALAAGLVLSVPHWLPADSLSPAALGLMVIGALALLLR
ncbi:ubiquinone biosynthesis regulatory protein kinase UbiB [Gilvimarinus sp. F26214L]|uniref:ubiquinone biosynthesis regulatory protein kinase UbiB n=1 Tax=Gilvimarinus sp. DZF01 TaxID=3461371 RepID=UPI004045348B